MTTSDLYMGLDLGTTSVKLCLYDKSTGQATRNETAVTSASVESGVNCNEQDSDAIFKAIEKCIAGIPLGEREHITGIGIAGQMHGVILWNRVLTQYANDCRYRKLTSNLYTWQDLRCSNDFLSSLPKPDSSIPISSGYGCATLFWLARNDPRSLEHFDHAGSIMDFLVFVLCGLDKPVMSEQLCCSWGYYNTNRHSWNMDM